MPLLDHFHPPLYPRRSWESFHSRWANSIADQRPTATRFTPLPIDLCAASRRI